MRTMTPTLAYLMTLAGKHNGGYFMVNTKQLLTVCLIFQLTALNVAFLSFIKLSQPNQGEKSNAIHYLD